MTRSSPFSVSGRSLRPCAEPLRGRPMVDDRRRGATRRFTSSRFTRPPRPGLPTISGRAAAVFVQFEEPALKRCTSRSRACVTSGAAADRHGLRCPQEIIGKLDRRLHMGKDMVIWVEINCRFRDGSRHGRTARGFTGGRAVLEDAVRPPPAGRGRPDIRGSQSESVTTLWRALRFSLIDAWASGEPS